MRVCLLFSIAFIFTGCSYVPPATLARYANMEQTADKDFGRVEISLDFTRQESGSSNQYAIWIQNQRGEVVRTLFVTRFTSDGGYAPRTRCCIKWADRANPDFLPQEEIDAFTGATPQTGAQVYTWDGIDRHGNRVPHGNYVFYIEGTMHWESWITYSGMILVGGPQRSIQPEYEVDSRDYNITGSDMIENVVVTYYPSGEN